MWSTRLTEYGYVVEDKTSGEVYDFYENGEEAQKQSDKLNKEIKK